MVSKDEKELGNALRTGSLKEIKHIFGKSTKPLNPKEVIKILRLLLGRSNFDFEMVKLLKNRQCDLNAPLGDIKTNPEQYRIGDYLAAYGRLSPRLIDEMAKAGYDFSKTNQKGEHAGFYLIANLAVNDRVISALKAKGVNFSTPNKIGYTASEMMYNHIKKYAQRMYLNTPTEVAIKRLSPLCRTQKDMFNLVRLQGKELKSFIVEKVAQIKPINYSDVGIQQILMDNQASKNLAYHALKEVNKHHLLMQDLQAHFISRCTPIALKKLGLLKEQEHA